MMSSLEGEKNFYPNIPAVDLQKKTSFANSYQKSDKSHS
jgi:hypothetical protein